MTDETPNLDDLLERATAALREESAAPNPRSGLTRARVLDSAEKRYASRRRSWLRWLIPATGMFVVGTALAQRAPEYWPAIREVLRPVLGLHESTPQRKPRPAPSTPPAILEPPAVVPQEPEAAAAPATLEVAPPETAPRKPAPPRPRAKAQAPVEPASAPSAAPEPAPPTRSAELELFRRAQQLHTARDPSALAAWDAYLRVAGKGVLVPEARYNRALCLIRLGRNADARLALAPFASGYYGKYRRSEAQALLAELK